MELALSVQKLEGSAATQMQNDPAFVRAIQLQRTKVIEQWVLAKTVDERESLWHDYHAVDRFIDQLAVVAGRGHMAQAAEKQHAVPATRSA